MKEKKSYLYTFAKASNLSDYLLAKMDTSKEVDRRRNLLNQSARENGFRDFNDCLEYNKGLMGEVVDRAMELYAIEVINELKP